MNFFLAGLISSLALDMHPSGGAWTCAVILALSWKRWQVWAGMALGVAYWWAIRLYFNSWQAFKTQMPYNYQYGQHKPVWWLVKGEFYRWHDFFWLGAYHRNMFILALLIVALWRLKYDRKRVDRRP